MEKQISSWKQILVILILCAAGYGIWHQREMLMQYTGISLGKQAQGEGRRGGRGGDRDVPVIVEAVKKVAAVDKIQSIGSGLATRSITIYPEVSGIVSEIDFDSGKRVKTGDVILKLDDAEAKIAVNIAKTKLTDAQRTLDRSLALLPKRAIAQATVDTAQTAVETAKYELEQAQEALADRTIRAPFDGVLGIPQVELGDRVSDSTAITTLDDRSVIIVEFDVPEIYLKRLDLGQKITATSAGFRGQAFEGEISEINSRVDTGTRAVRVRAALKNTEDQLRSGMSFMVSLVLEGAEFPSIPELALLWESDGAYVWRVMQGKADRVNVSVVKRVQGRILVDGDLTDGQLVVVEGTQRLRPGREVSFEEPEKATSGKAGL